MISTVWKPARMKAIDLPSFCYLVGECGAQIPVIVRHGARSRTVILIPAETRRHGVVYNADKEFDVLVPSYEGLDDLEIEIDLFLRGAL